MNHFPGKNHVTSAFHAQIVVTLGLHIYINPQRSFVLKEPWGFSQASFLGADMVWSTSPRVLTVLKQAVVPCAHAQGHTGAPRNQGTGVLS